MLSILQATADRNLFAAWFKDRNTWSAWFSFLAALFALPMTDEQRAIYRECTGRADPPTSPAKEAWLVVGRRGGKSFILALCAVFLACFYDWRPYLANGERGVVVVVAADRKQAKIILRYVRALLQVPMLRQLVERETAEAFDLTNSISIEVATASYRTIRGYAVVAALLDELAFWPQENSAEPDTEIIGALKPGMAQFPNALLLCASSQYARRGALYVSHRKYFGKEQDPVLVWQAPTRRMNPSIPQAIIDEAMEKDASAAAAEYLAQFRSDVESFVSREAIAACVSLGILERPPRAGARYVAFVDPSGGSNDSFTLAIGHKDADNVFLDAVREVRPPFSPEAVVSEFAATVRSYGLSRVSGDRYAGEWPREQFRKLGIAYEPSRQPASDLYVSVLPLINSRRAALLDHPRLLGQLAGLERHTGRSGRDSISHRPGSHDDLANAVAGALVLAQTPAAKIRMWMMHTESVPVNGSVPTTTELNIRTGRPLELPRHNPLAPGPHNECWPGKGKNTQPWRH